MNVISSDTVLTNHRKDKDKDTIEGGEVYGLAGIAESRYQPAIPWLSHRLAGDRTRSLLTTPLFTRAYRLKYIHAASANKRTVDIHRDELVISVFLAMAQS
jgi:hypothetical protein